MTWISSLFNGFRPHPQPCERKAEEIMAQNKAIQIHLRAMKATLNGEEGWFLTRVHDGGTKK